MRRGLRGASAAPCHLPSRNRALASRTGGGGVARRLLGLWLSLLRARLRLLGRRAPLRLCLCARRRCARGAADDRARQLTRCRARKDGCRGGAPCAARSNVAFSGRGRAKTAGPCPSISRAAHSMRAHARAHGRTRRTLSASAFFALAFLAFSAAGAPLAGIAPASSAAPSGAAIAHPPPPAPASPAAPGGASFARCTAWCELAVRAMRSTRGGGVERAGRRGGKGTSARALWRPPPPRPTSPYARAAATNTRHPATKTYTSDKSKPILTCTPSSAALAPFFCPCAPQLPFFFFLDVFACLQQLSEIPNAFCRASASDSCS